MNLVSGADWLKLNYSDNSFTLYGIPQLDSLGDSQFLLERVRVDDDEGLELSSFRFDIFEEDESPCATEESTYWIEVLVDSEIESLEEQMYGDSESMTVEQGLKRLAFLVR